MNDLIRREEAIAYAISGLTREIDGENWIRVSEVRESIKALPSAQSEIIRCKDCKWCVEHYDTDENAPYWVCKNWDGGTDADGYCHEAERKE